MALDPMRYFLSLVFPDAAWPPEMLRLEWVPGFDRGNVNYIQ